MADVRVPQLPPPPGAIAANDLIIVYMQASDMTVKVPISSLGTLLAQQTAAILAAPGMSLSGISNTHVQVTLTSVANAQNYKFYRSITSIRTDAVLLATQAGLIYNDTNRLPATRYWYWASAIASGFQNSPETQGDITTTGPVADVTPPVLSTAIISDNNRTQIVLTYNETLQTIANALTTQWIINGGSVTPTSVAISGLTVSITIGFPFVSSDVITLTYNGNQVKDVAGNLAATFTNQPVTNNIALLLTQLPTPALTALVLSPTSVRLNWNDVVGESSYVLQRSPDGITWTTIGTGSTGQNIITFTDTGLLSGTNYYWRVKAVGNNTTYSDSGWGTTNASTQTSASATFDTLLTVPIYSTSVSAAGVSITKVYSQDTRSLEFNADTTRTGGPMTMRIYNSTGITLELLVDFASDYNGLPFRFTIGSTVYLGNFTNGSIILP